MSSQLIESQREKAMVYTGLGVCKEKAKDLFKKFGLPNAIFYLDDVFEFGYNESTGFMWLKRPKKTEQVHPKLGKKVLLDVEVTMFIEERVIKKITGFKVKEMMLWVSVGAAKFDGSDHDKLTFISVRGNTRSFPFSMFVLDD